jgi:hypothetical protein
MGAARTSPPTLGPRVGALMALLGGAMTIFAVVGVVDEAHVYAESEASVHWTRVPGTIVDAHVNRAPGEPPNFTPSVLYSYEIGGRSHMGKTVVFGSIHGYERSNGIVAAYPRGERVTVWVDPTDVSKAVLQPQSWEGERMLLFYLLLSGAFGGVTVLGILAVLRNGLFRSSGASERSRESQRLTPPIAALVQASELRAVVRVSGTSPHRYLALAVAVSTAASFVACIGGANGWFAAVVFGVQTSIAFALRALPAVAFARSGLAPARSRAVVEKASGAGYRESPGYAASIDGRSMGPDTRRAVLEILAPPFSLLAVAIGSEVGVVTWDAQPSESVDGQSASKETPLRHRSSLGSVRDALARVLDVTPVTLRSAERLPKPSDHFALLTVTPALLHVAAAVAIVGLAADAPQRLRFVVACTPFVLLVESGLYRWALERYRRPLEALAREIRGHAAGGRDEPQEARAGNEAAGDKGDAVDRELQAELTRRSTEARARLDENALRLAAEAPPAPDSADAVDRDLETMPARRLL